MGLKAAAHRSKMNRHSKNPTGYFGNPTEPRKPDTDIENDTGGETDHDTVTVNAGEKIDRKFSLKFPEFRIAYCW